MVKSAIEAPQTSLMREIRVSKKITSCSYCRKLKIKCDMTHGLPCVRCSRRDLNCVLDKSLQTILQEGEVNMRTLTNAVQFMLAKLDLPSLEEFHNSDGAQLPSPRLHDDESTDPSTKGEQATSPPIVTDPMETLYEITQLEDIRHARTGTTDNYFASLISRGLLSRRDSEDLYLTYRTKLDPLQFAVMDNWVDLGTVARASGLLALCVCTLAANHDPQREPMYQNLRKELLNMASTSVFRSRHNVYDVLALALAACYLTTASWAMKSISVIIATELQVNKAYERFQSGDVSAAEELKIWYILYTVDHYLAVAYDRPKMIPDDHLISEWPSIAAQISSDSRDWRIFSQVSYFSIMIRASDLFKVDKSFKILIDFDKITEILNEVDEWTTFWCQKISALMSDNSVASISIRIPSLFSKIFLCSRAFQASAKSESCRECRDIAVNSAMKLMELIEEPLTKSVLVGVSGQILTMLAFAVVFLLKLVASRELSSHADESKILDLLRNVSTIFVSVAQAPVHLLRHISVGLKETLRRIDTRGNDVYDELSGLDPGNISTWSDIGLDFLVSSDYDNNIFNLQF